MKNLTPHPLALIRNQVAELFNKAFLDKKEDAAAALKLVLDAIDGSPDAHEARSSNFWHIQYTETLDALQTSQREVKRLNEALNPAEVYGASCNVAEFEKAREYARRH